MAKNKKNLSDMKRVQVRVSDNTYERIKYWSESKDMSINEYLLDAIDRQIRFDNKDFDYQDIFIDKMNEIIDTIEMLKQTDDNLANIVVSGFNSLLSLTRGDNNYLRDDLEDMDA